jgi:hypothetical protein
MGTVPAGREAGLRVADSRSQARARTGVTCKMEQSARSNGIDELGDIVKSIVQRERENLKQWYKCVIDSTIERGG